MSGLQYKVSWHSPRAPRIPQRRNIASSLALSRTRGRCEFEGINTYSLGGVTAKEALLVEDDDVATVEVDGVSSTQAGHCERSVRGRQRQEATGENTYDHHRQRLLSMPLCKMCVCVC